MNDEENSEHPVESYATWNSDGCPNWNGTMSKIQCLDRNLLFPHSDFLISNPPFTIHHLSISCSSFFPEFEIQYLRLSFFFPTKRLFQTVPMFIRLQFYRPSCVWSTIPPFLAVITSFRILLHRVTYCSLSSSWICDEFMPVICSYCPKIFD